MLQFKEFILVFFFIFKQQLLCDVLYKLLFLVVFSKLFLFNAVVDCIYKCPTEGHWKNVPVETFLQNYCFSHVS